MLSRETEAYRLLIADVYELAGLSRRISDAEAAGCGATAAQWHVLSVVSEEPVTVPAVAARLGLARQGVQRVVDDLLAAGRVASTPNPAHKRSPLVGLTDAGRQVLADLWATSTPRREASLERSGLDAEDLGAARATIRELTAALRAAPPA
jgi:DNA-binding MarR family transcriptional regulator